MKENKTIFTETFNKLSSTQLNEEQFYLNDEEDQIVMNDEPVDGEVVQPIVDPELGFEDVRDLDSEEKKSYIGKKVCLCNICMQPSFDEITEESVFICPVCGTEDDYTIVGVIVPEAEAEEILNDEDSENIDQEDVIEEPSEEDEEDLIESIKESKSEIENKVKDFIVSSLSDIIEEKFQVNVIADNISGYDIDWAEEDGNSELSKKERNSLDKYADSLVDVLFANKEDLKESKEITESVKSKKYYHGSKEKFEKFTKGDIGFHFGSKEQALNRINGEGYLYNVELNYSNPLDVDDTDFDSSTDLINALFTRNILTREEYDELREKYNSTDVTYDSELANLLREKLSTKGYDSLVYDNAVEGNGKSIVVFNPSQITILKAEEVGSEITEAVKDVALDDFGKKALKILKIAGCKTEAEAIQLIRSILDLQDQKLGEKKEQVKLAFKSLNGKIDESQITVKTSDAEVEVTTDDEEEKEQNIEEPEEVVELEYNFNESKFNSLVNKFLTDNYKNIKSFNIIEGKISNIKDNLKKITLEGLITFNNKDVKRVRFISDSFDFKNGALRTKLQCSAFGDSKSFLLEGTIDNNSIESSALKYRFRTMQEGKAYEVFGNALLENSKNK